MNLLQLIMLRFNLWVYSGMDGQMDGQTDRITTANTRYS